MSPSPKPSLATLFYRNGHLLTLSILFLLAAGLSSVISLPRLEDPRITNRNPLLVVPVPGASAERVESQVTEVLENALQEIAEISTIESNSRAGIVTIGIELEDAVTPDTNQAIFAEIRDKVGEVRPLLPPEALDPFLDDQRGPIGYTQLIALLPAPNTPTPLTLLDRHAAELADRLRNVPGTELVRVFGAPEEEITVTVDPLRLADLGLDATAVAGAVAQADAKGAAGILRGQRSDLLLEVEGALDSTERIAAVPLVEGADGALVRLGDIARVAREPRQPASDITLVDGERAVLVGVRMSPDQRVDRWAVSARAVVDDFRLQQGDSLRVDTLFEQEQYTSHQLANLGQNLAAGAVVVVVVIFLMMGWRLALIVGLALPLVISVVFFSWQLTGGAIHQMSMFGMIIGLGLLIDNAIVVADEVTHHKAAGHGGGEAVARAVHHLFYPLLASTLTTVLAFAPILLLPGSVGDFVGSIGSSVITAILASFLLALTLTAALAGRLARPTPAGERRRFWRDGLGSERLAERFRRTLRWGLARPAIALLFALFLPASGFLAARTLGNEFFPPVDRDMFQVKLWLPTDSSIERTRQQVLEVEEMLRSFPETERVFWRVGASFPTVYYNQIMNQEGAAHYAQGIVVASSTQEARDLLDRLQVPLHQRFPAAQIVARQFGQGPPIPADVEYRLFGPELATLQDLGERIRRTLDAHPEVLHTRMSLPRGEPKLWLRADEDEARLAGLRLTDIARQLQANLEGGVGGTVIEGLEQLPVRVRYDDTHRSDLARVASTPLVRPGAPDWVTLPALGELELAPAPGGITRYNGERVHKLSGYTHNDALPIDVSSQVLAALDEEGFRLPPGYRLELGGAQEQDAKAKGKLLIYAPLLVLLTIATLVLSFRSVAKAALLLSVALLSVGLGLLSTRLMGLPVSFNTILGTLGLIGVALNDSIVVLAALEGNARARAGDLEAIVHEVMGCTRHVLATTFTTIGGFLPLLLFVGGDFWPSLAIVLAGGIAGASILALVLIPAVFTLLHRPQTQIAPLDLAPQPGVS